MNMDDLFSIGVVTGGVSGVSDIGHRALRQHPQLVFQVLHPLLQPRQPPMVAALLRVLVQAELALTTEPGSVWAMNLRRHAVSVLGV
jgi:hypothetical protein